jgi:hypothetical protein
MHFKIPVHQMEKSSKDIFLISLSVVAAYIANAALLILYWEQ